MTNPIQFLKEVKSELGKVVWPSRRETLRISTAVVIISLIVAGFLGAVDYGLTKLIEFVLEQR
jgi:preprotein translocase subunit SecE